MASMAPWSRSRDRQVFAYPVVLITDDQQSDIWYKERVA
jgi:hypothetical protein